ncbi:MAG: glycine--tRNA ligase subunit beta [Coxiellaceae bacterium]|nr:glycine--tRNA ligase subunit beta [Coxiellaceae bacterium]
METRDFLVEIGCEELPPKSLLMLAETLQQQIEAGLQKAELQYGASQCFATPRRLAVLINGLVVKQPPRKIVRQGPSAAAAYDKTGAPTLACMGFARSCGVSVDQVEKVETEKGTYLQCTVDKPGVSTAELLPDVVQKAVNQLPIPKPMRWGDSDVQFVRPVKWVVMLFGRQVVSAKLFDIKADRKTYGHRFMHPEAISLEQASDYVDQLKNEGQVVVNYQQRQSLILDQIKQVVSKHGKVVLDEDLLSEVTALVEWPVVMLGEFKRDFLAVPAEALICSMQSHQKCFAVTDPQGNLQPYFVLVSNLVSKDPKVIVKGNERVINARLSDADFFYRQDLKQSLAGHSKALERVVFQKQLGTVAEKAHRIGLLAAAMARKLKLDEKLAKRAAHLVKCDLLTEMVGEFPSLQGTMGAYYATHDKEDSQVIDAIKEQYSPKFAGDQIPASGLGACIAIADKLDSLVGIIGIKQIPTGDKDPFALRRAALGVLRILIETPMPLDLMELIKVAHKNYKGVLSNKDAVQNTFDFCIDRLKAFYADQGVSVNVFESVAAIQPTQPVDFDLRIQAVKKFQSLPEAQTLAAANKRVRNILKKQDSKNIPKVLDKALFDSDAESGLAKQLAEQTKRVETLYGKADYAEALSQLSSLKEPVDTFFDEVMIMDEDKKKRANRLAMLQQLRQLFTQVADISLLQD